MRKQIIVLAAALSLAACTTSQQNAVTGALADVGTATASGQFLDAAGNLIADALPIAAAVVGVAVPQVAPVLTVGAKLACEQQAAANAAGDTQMSFLAGLACKW